jgi:3-oxoacyl-[acyl-carrier protein] reductase
MDLGLKGKVAIITGATRGIGRDVAEGLAAEETQLSICARNEAALKEVAKEIEKTYGVSVLPVRTDVSKPEEIKALVDKTVKKFGRLDILVNNAGEAPRGPSAISEEGWQIHVDQYLFSVIRLSREVLPHMIAQKWGRIINISSVAGLRPNSVSPIAVTKAAVNNFGEGLAREVAQYNILVNSVCPGLVWTERLGVAGSIMEDIGKMMGLPKEEATMKYVAQNIPLGRFIQTREVSDTVVFLASERASGITGTTISIDGGAGRAMWPGGKFIKKEEKHD